MYHVPLTDESRQREEDALFWIVFGALFVAYYLTLSVLFIVYVSEGEEEEDIENLLTTLFYVWFLPLLFAIDRFQSLQFLSVDVRFFFCSL